MREHEGGLELAWILWTCVAVLFLIFGVVELVRPQAAISFWLIAGVLSTGCSILALIPSLRRSRAEDTLASAMKDGDLRGDLDAQFQSSDETKGLVADAALALVEAQVLAQVADDASVDGRATGLVGFNGALLAAAVAARDLLGHYWLVPVGVVAVVTLMLLFGVLYEKRGDFLRKPHRLALGVRAGEFYETYSASSPLKARELLLGDLADAFEGNATQITRKRRWLQSATLLLVGGLAVAALLIALNEPTKMSACPKTQLQNCPGQGSNQSGRAAQFPKTSLTGRLGS